MWKGCQRSPEHLFSFTVITFFFPIVVLKGAEGGETVYVLVSRGEVWGLIPQPSEGNIDSPFFRICHCQTHAINYSLCEYGRQIANKARLFHHYIDLKGNHQRVQVFPLGDLMLEVFFFFFLSFKMFIKIFLGGHFPHLFTHRFCPLDRKKST